MERKTRNLIRITAVCLLILCLCPAVGCAKSREPALISCGDHSVGVAYYELLLSRMRGNLARSGYDVESEEFWNTDSGVGGKTYEEYYNDVILRDCKTAVAALELFDELGLALPKSYLDGVQEDIAFYISYDGGESEARFNEILAPFGVNVESLREAYIIEAKIKYLKVQVYGTDGSLIGDAVKNEFYKKNYYRFKQILVQNFYYCYEEDSFGSEIYFDAESGKILYDQKNGKPKFDADKNYIRDDFGTPIYYDADGKPLYDKENGVRAIVKDDSGEAIPFYYSKAEMEERVAKVTSEVYKTEPGDFYAFEELIKKYSDVVTGAYPDGNYVSEIEKSGYSDSLLDILAALGGMETGEIATLESEFGTRFIMKYELDDGAYDNGEHKDWFESMNDTLIEQMFLESCRIGAENARVDDAVLAGARSIATLGTNFYY